MPVVVRIGGAPDRARAWYARKMKPNVSIKNSRGRAIDFETSILARFAAALWSKRHTLQLEVWLSGHSLQYATDSCYRV